jgi:hypothetical protein
VQGLPPEGGRRARGYRVRARGAPLRKAVLAVPPPGTGESVVDTCSVIVLVMRCPAMAVCGTVLIVWPGGPMVKGAMPMFGRLGPAPAELAVPWATIVVPCGIEASRATAAASLGLAVLGMFTHRPGSMCRPALRFASEICRR